MKVVCTVWERPKRKSGKCVTHEIVIDEDAILGVAEEMALAAGVISGGIIYNSQVEHIVCD